MWIVSQWWLYDIHLDCLLSGSFPCQTVLCPANYSNKYNWNEKSSLFFDSRMLSNKSELVIYRFAWFRLEWKNGKRLMKSWPFFFITVAFIPCKYLPKMTRNVNRIMKWLTTTKWWRIRIRFWVLIFALYFLFLLFICSVFVITLILYCFFVCRHHWYWSKLI